METFYVWVMYNDNPNNGRIGYYVTAGKMTRVQAEAQADAQHSRLVMPILESEERVQLIAQPL